MYVRPCQAFTSLHIAYGTEAPCIQSHLKPQPGPATGS
jgi:hypothetical protein